ncbi:MAG TPA: methyltransferase domain-containing protein [Chloroflexota bacterium]|nr:methyltransferase domain-containing protein [Chloroflexota bacterium]
MENETVTHEATARAPNPSPLATLAPILRCPSCEGPLALEDRTLICPARHSFDLAREGYVNLSQSRQTGDSVEMLRARRRFLDAGHYQPLSDLINRLAAEHRPDTPCTVLDAGCGEGYYLGRLHQHRLCRTLGLDAAKDAARMAAGRYRATAFLVADLTKCLPLAAGAIDVLLNIFAPRHAEEFARVLQPDGLLLTVIPQPDHLAELRRRLPLLGIENRKEDQVRATLGKLFVPIGVECLSYPLSLTKDAAGDLVGMTPTARHLDAATRADLAAPGAGPLTVTASFLVLSFRRRYT